MGFFSYWTLAIKNLTVNSNSISLPTSQSSYAVIDTEITLIGGPAAQVAAVFPTLLRALDITMGITSTVCC